MVGGAIGPHGVHALPAVVQEIILAPEHVIIRYLEMEGLIVSELIQRQISATLIHVQVNDYLYKNRKSQRSIFLFYSGTRMAVMFSQLHQ